MFVVEAKPSRKANFHDRNGTKFQHSFFLNILAKNLPHILPDILYCINIGRYDIGIGQTETKRNRANNFVLRNDIVSVDISYETKRNKNYYNQPKNFDALNPEIFSTWLSGSMGD